MHVEVARRCSAVGTSTRSTRRGGRASRRGIATCSSSIGERRIVLTSALDPCLVAYTMPEWVGLRGAPRRSSRSSTARSRSCKRIYVSGAVECEVDDSGRILVPPHAPRARAASRRTCSGPAAASTPSSGTRTRGSEHFEIATDDERARSRRASRSSAYERRAAARAARPQLALPGVVESVEWVWARGDETERRDALRPRDRDEAPRSSRRSRRAGGVYVDATRRRRRAHRGDPRGGARARASSRSIATPTALEAARERLAPFGDRVTLVHARFARRRASTLATLGHRARRRARAPISA